MTLPKLNGKLLTYNQRLKEFSILTVTFFESTATFSMAQRSVLLQLNCFKYIQSSIVDILLLLYRKVFRSKCSPENFFYYIKKIKRHKFY